MIAYKNIFCQCAAFNIVVVVVAAAAAPLLQMLRSRRFILQIVFESVTGWKRCGQKCFAMDTEEDSGY